MIPTTNIFLYSDIIYPAFRHSASIKGTVRSEQWWVKINRLVSRLVSMFDAF